MKGDKEEEEKGGERGGQEWETERKSDKGMMKRKEKTEQWSCGRERHMEEVGRGSIKTLKSKSTLKTEELTGVVWSRFM